VVGKRDVVEVVIHIVDIEGCPAAVVALHAFDPFDTSFNGHIVAWTYPCPARTVHRHDHNRGVVEVGIMWICILKGPTARAYMRTPIDPIPCNIENLKWA
jgi:hypothetical protein